MPSSSADHEFQYKWAVITGVSSGLALAGTAGLLWGDRRRAALDAAQDSQEDCYEYDDGTSSCSGSFSWGGPGVINRRAFLFLPFLPAATSMALAMVSGDLLGRARPRPNGERYVVAGSITLVAGAALFLVGRFHRPSCLRQACVARWFDLDASLYTGGAAMVGVGGGLITYGRASIRARVRPRIALGHDHAEVGLSLRF
ncbi:MAG: hypothetical protein KDK70_14395 [Myxococcales bacterium]|nr:hypothetical protein [Myxococcales bacterium]